MASSTNSFSSNSDEGGTDEQQKHPQFNNEPQPSTGNLPLGMTPPSAQFMRPEGHLDMGQNMVQAPYPFMDPYYGSIMATYQEGQPAVHPYYLGVQPGLPLPSDAVEEPVYVNAKQYRGILRRRQSRAKAESENKLIKSRKPYLHESRHLHALKRARGCGGRFLTAKDEENNGSSSQDKSQAPNDPSPEMQENMGSSNYRAVPSTGTSCNGSHVEQLESILADEQTTERTSHVSHN